MESISKVFFLVVGLIFVSILGCNRGDGKGSEKERAAGFTFFEASQGLPSSGLWRQRIGFCDINMDGHMDILATPPRHAGENYKVPVAWYGNGEGAWRETVLDAPADEGYGYGAITGADFNGDGVPDIAMAIHAVGLAALKGAGNGTYADFSDGFPLSAKFASRALVAADFNADGISDIAAVSEGSFGKSSPEPSGIWICSLRADKWTCGPACGDPSLVSGLFADDIAVGDVNGDGKADLAIASLAADKNLIVWINGEDGRFVPFNEGLPQEKYYFSVALEDLNGDGRDDLVAYIAGPGREGYVGLKAFLSREAGFEDIS